MAGDTETASLHAKLFGLLYYCCSSISVQLINKALFTTYNFNCPLLVGLFQMVFLTPVCFFAARPRLEWGLAKMMLPLAFVNVLNLASGLMGTAGLSVPMFIALRRFTLLATLLLERVIDRKRHDSMTHMTIAVMLAGAVIAALTDLTFNVRGYAAVFVNNLVTALFLVMIKRISSKAGLTTTGLLFYKALLSIPMLLVLAYASPEVSQALAYPGLRKTSFQLVVAGAAALGVTINHSTFVCTRVNDAMMTTVAGNLKNVIVTVLGAVLFSDYIFSWPNCAGLTLSMIGACWYAAVASMRATRKSPLEKLPHNGIEAGEKSTLLATKQ
mmetsp:Transcript_315/g.904  ORF Transcript_315/g.904 Transcript_315/m.904 type:complete len:328 (+) Transcript_315:347-1330(+)